MGSRGLCSKVAGKAAEHDPCVCRGSVASWQVMETETHSIAGAPHAMPSRAELLNAVAVAESLLARVGLRDYRFSVEPRDGPWRLKVHTALAGGWYEVEVEIDRHALTTDSDAHLEAVRNALVQVGLPVTLH